MSNREAESQEICRKIKPFIWLAKFKLEYNFSGAIMIKKWALLNIK